MSPRVRDEDWRGEYHDPVSDEEDERAARRAKELNDQIMRDIEECQRDIEMHEHGWDDDDEDDYEDAPPYLDDSELFGDGCVFGADCVCPHPYHTPDECATAEMMEEWMGDDL